MLRLYPRQMYERFRAIESIAYEIRKKLNHKTRVKIGRDDIELSTREANSSVWRMQVLPDSLPEFEMKGSAQDLMWQHHHHLGGHEGMVGSMVGKC